MSKSYQNQGLSMQIKNRYISNLIYFTNHYFGWRNWSVLVYNSVIENMFVLFYIALRQQLYSIQFVLHFFIFLLFSSFCTTYGYLINDLGDIELDKLHGKDNTFKDDSKVKSFLIVLIFLMLSIISSLPFTGNPFFLTLFISWLCIATAYSVKPFRLKERGKVGLIFVVMAQRVLPALLIFSAFKHYEWIDVLVFTFYIFFRGLSSDLNHQLEDYQKDAGTETDTYAVKAGFKKAHKIFRLSLEIEKGLFIICLLIIFFKLKNLQLFGIPLILPVLLVYLLFYVLTWMKIIKHGVKISPNPFTSGRNDIFQFIYHPFPTIILPFYILFLLLFKNWIFIILLIFFIICRKMYSLELIRNSFPVKAIRNLI
ncbi:hypothetical protein ES705_11591 [subsurface metagenome]